MTPRRELTVAAALCGLGAILVLIAAGRTWVSVAVDLPRPLPDTTHTLSGQQLAPVAGALGIAGLAGLAGLVATKGHARQVVGGLLAIFGVAVAYASWRATGQVSVYRALAAEHLVVRGGGAVPQLTAWWMVSFGGGVLLACSGAVTLVHGRGWPGMSRKYDAPRSAHSGQAGEPVAGASEDMWESLDHGRDPTR